MGLFEIERRHGGHPDNLVWARTFTLVWFSFGALVLLLWAFRSLGVYLTIRWSDNNGTRSVRSRTAYASLAGEEDDKRTAFNTRGRDAGSSAYLTSRIHGLQAWFMSFTLWTHPSLNLNAGQMVVVLAYFATLLTCILHSTRLSDNRNRPAFIALAQLPPLFLLATKSSPLTLIRLFRPSLLSSGREARLAPSPFSYAELNYLHRWIGRGFFATITLHGSLWITERLRTGKPIIGQEMETTGLIAWTLFVSIVLSSLPTVRKALYRVFFYIHIVGFVAFVVVIRLHTHHAMNWLAFSLGVYILDLLARSLAIYFSLKKTDRRGVLATAQPINEEMTLITIPNPGIQWRAGQHLRLRVLFGKGKSTLSVESHPFSILGAPETVVGGKEGSIVLGVRAAGDWTRALNALVRERISETAGEGEVADNASQFVIEDEGDGHSDDGHATGPDDRLSASDSAHYPPISDLPRTASTATAQVRVLLDGPYGGCHLNVGSYERAVLIAGGSGATFTLGLLDDIVGRCVRLGRRGGERTGRVDFVWVVRSFDSISWFASILREISHVATTSSDSSLDLRITIFMTRSSDADTTLHDQTSRLLGLDPSNLNIRAERPDMYRLMNELIFSSPSHSSQHPDMESDDSIPLEDIEKGSYRTRDNSPTGGDAETDEDGLEDPTSAVPLLQQERSHPSENSTPRRARGGNGGGIAVCVSGPQTLMHAVSNSVARLSLTRGVALGGIDLHTEAFSL